MSTTTAILIFASLAFLIILAFFSVFRHKGKFKIKSVLGEVSAEGENAPSDNSSAEKQPQVGNVTESPFEQISAGSTKIGQVGTGANVFLAQPGSNIIVQTGERPAPKLDSPQIEAATSTTSLDSPAQEAEQTLQPSSLDDNLLDECDTPPPILAWVGRSTELSLMETSGIKVIAITGIGGQGKSTLAAKFLVNGENASRFYDWRDCKEEGNTLHTQIVRIIERITKG
jgi:hypothetical protein